jgi:predicted enzyme related to lactoylglutathione lyase
MAMTMVQDIERATRFYRDTLGLTVQEEQEDWVIFAEGIGLRVSDDPIPEINFNFNAVVVTLFVADAFAAYAELVQKGVAFFLPPTDAGGAILATFRDTENNMVQLMQLPE